MYRCNCCNKVFDTASFYYERHNLDSPPYEKIAVCPYCEGDNFDKYDISVEKIEVAEAILPIIAALNRYCLGLKDVFGADCINSDLNDGFFGLCEFVSELFPFMSTEMEKQMMNINTDKDVANFLLCLRG